LAHARPDPKHISAFLDLLKDDSLMHTRQSASDLDKILALDEGICIAEFTNGPLRSDAQHYLILQVLGSDPEFADRKFKAGDTVAERFERFTQFFRRGLKEWALHGMKVKEVWVDDRRYIVCHNEDQAKKDRADREAIVAALRDQLKRGAKSLVGNKGYRKFLKTRSGGGFDVDEAKIESEARFDGKWVLQTDTELTAAECALKYKQLGIVERLFRSMKSILETRPIYHKCDETIRGHVFCSFLALLLLKELEARLAARSWQVEWERLRDDLDALEEITVRTRGRTFVIRSDLQGDAGKAIQAVGVALGSVVRLEEVAEAAQPRSQPIVSIGCRLVVTSWRANACRQFPRAPPRGERQPLCASAAFHIGLT